MSKETKDIITRASALLQAECEDARLYAQSAIDAAYDGELEQAYEELNHAYMMAA